MSRRQKRDTRTVTFVGGPRDGTSDQAPREADGVLDQTATPYAFHRYAGPVGGGSAVFTYEGLVDPDGAPTTIAAAVALFESEMGEAIAAGREGSAEVEAILQHDAEERARAVFGGGRP